MESFPPDDATAKAMMARNTAAHRLIGLIPPGCDPEKAFTDATSVFVPAIYDHRSGTLGIVKRESELDYDSLSLRVSIVHELTHAMDDQYYDLDSLMESGGGHERRGRSVRSHHRRRRHRDADALRGQSRPHGQV